MKGKIDRQKEMFVKDIAILTGEGYTIAKKKREVKKSLVKETTTIADIRGKEVAKVIVTYEPIHLD